jgi:hypothetical protein
MVELMAVKRARLKDLMAKLKAEMLADQKVESKDLNLDRLSEVQTVGKKESVWVSMKEISMEL